MSTTYSFTFGSQKVSYTLGQPFVEDGNTVMQVVCPKLGINQTFLLEDIPELILDLPNMLANLKKSEKKQAVIKFRLPQAEKELIEKKALAAGHSSTASFLRERALA